MTPRTKLLIAALVGIAVVAGTAVHAQGDAAGQLRASGHVGEQADGYLGLVDSAGADLRAQMEQVNAATACQLFASRVGPGQYYRLPDGVWRRRNGSEPVPRPSHCG